MIIVLVGGIGSGKTLSAVKMIVESKNFSYLNFTLKNVDKNSYQRLKFEDLLIKDEKKGYKGVNWKFWNEQIKKHKNFSIYLDEIHNIIHARQSMSKRNVFLGRWLSQIRKILSDSLNNHLVIITQRFEKLDVEFRDMAHVIITCEKIEVKKKVYIVQRYYDSDLGFYNNIHKKKRVFMGNKFFKNFNTLGMVQFGEDEYL